MRLGAGPGPHARRPPRARRAALRAGRRGAPGARARRGPRGGRAVGRRAPRLEFADALNAEFLRQRARRAPLARRDARARLAGALAPAARGADDALRRALDAHYRGAGVKVRHPPRPRRAPVARAPPRGRAPRRGAARREVPRAACASAAGSSRRWPTRAARLGAARPRGRAVADARRRARRRAPARARAPRLGAARTVTIALAHGPRRALPGRDVDVRRRTPSSPAGGERRAAVRGEAHRRALEAAVRVAAGRGARSRRIDAELRATHAAAQRDRAPLDPGARGRRSRRSSSRSRRSSARTAPGLRAGYARSARVVIRKKP